MSSLVYSSFLLKATFYFSSHAALFSVSHSEVGSSRSRGRLSLGCQSFLEMPVYSNLAKISPSTQFLCFLTNSTDFKPPKTELLT